MRRGLGLAIISVVVIAAALVVTAVADHDPGDDTATVAVDDPPGAGDATTAPATTSDATTRGPRGSGRPVTFAFAGDTQFPDVFDTDPGVTSTGDRTLAEQLLADPAHVLDPVAPVLASADLAVVNLETAITERGEPVAGKRYHFRSPPATFRALEAAGVDVAAMANNHALDYGPEGMADTFAAVDDTDVAVTGIGHDAAEAFRPFRTVVNGQRIAILNAVDWVEPALVDSWSASDTQAGLAFMIDPTRLLEAVRAVRGEVDTLVVFLHWGVEETSCATPAQQDFVTTLIAEGVDIVVGSHTHRVFGAGRVGPALVAYGLGNFTYFREDGESGRSGVLLVTATGREIDGYSWVPARITHGIPMPLEGADAAADIAEWEARRGCSGLSP